MGELSQADCSTNLKGP